MGLVTGYLLKKFVQWAENKIKENPLYLKCTGHITIAASNNTELNCFLEAAIKNAKTNSLIAELQDEDLIRSIDQNIDIISNCIVRTRHQLPSDNFLMGITYDNDNEEYQKKMETFYKSLYEQLQDKKQNYPTLQNIQMQMN